LPGDKVKHEYPSTFTGVRCPGAAFEGKKEDAHPGQFSGRHVDTAGWPEAADPVPWTKPRHDYDPKKMPRSVPFRRQVHVAFADGSGPRAEQEGLMKIWHLLIQRDVRAADSGFRRLIEAMQ